MQNPFILLCNTLRQALKSYVKSLRMQMFFKTHLQTFPIRKQN